jgi:hypothetical protein
MCCSVASLSTNVPVELSPSPIDVAPLVPRSRISAGAPVDRTCPPSEMASLANVMLLPCESTTVPAFVTIETLPKIVIAPNAFTLFAISIAPPMMSSVLIMFVGPAGTPTGPFNRTLPMTAFSARARGVAPVPVTACSVMASAKSEVSAPIATASLYV